MSAVGHPQPADRERTLRGSAREASTSACDPLPRRHRLPRAGPGAYHALKVEGGVMISTIKKDTNVAVLLTVVCAAAAVLVYGVLSVIGH